MPPRRPYTRFSLLQVQYLRANYAELPSTHFAERWGVGIKSIYQLAKRHSIRKRAPNGQPVWRGKSQAWGAGSRWAT